jgi:hypothetical protein
MLDIKRHGIENPALTMRCSVCIAVGRLSHAHGMVRRNTAEDYEASA